MLGICGYNFCGDKNALNVAPTNVNKITSTTLQNGIFDNFNMTKDTTSPYNCDIPIEWDFSTMMNANFNGNINAGNVDYIVDQIRSVKIKRRKVDTFDWIALEEIPVSVTEDLKFSTKDMYNAHEEDYEYAIVPIMADGTEGEYLTNQVHSEFNGVFICDIDTIFKLVSNVNYGGLTSVVKQGVHETMGRKYPIITYNSDIDYLTGNVGATVLPSDYLETRKIDRVKFAKEQEKVSQFLNNKRCKILKDYNGNIWLMVITDSPTLTYNNATNMAIGDANFSWVQQGDANNQSDLYNTGMTKVVE